MKHCARIESVCNESYKVTIINLDFQLWLGPLLKSFTNLEILVKVLRSAAR